MMVEEYPNLKSEVFEQVLGQKWVRWQDVLQHRLLIKKIECAIFYGLEKSIDRHAIEHCRITEKIIFGDV